MLRIPAVASLALLLLAGQAQAGSVVIKNDAWVVARAQITGTPHPDQWDSILLGKTHAFTFPADGQYDVQVTVQYLTLFQGWKEACVVRVHPSESRSITMSGTAFGAHCNP